jgi:replicative DNA helicase
MELFKYSNLEAEQCLLGCILLDNQSIIHVFDEINSGDFYDSRHEIIYRSCIELFAKSQGIDQITLTDKLREKKELEKITEYYILSICEKVPSAANIKEYLRIIKDNSKRRKVAICLNKNKEIGLAESVDEKIQEIQKELTLISEMKSDRDIDFQSSIEKNDQILQSRLNYGKNILGYQWSIQELTKKTGGIELPFVYVLGALKKTGKSKFVIDQIYNLYRQNIPTLFFSLEMGETQITRWLWSRFSAVDSLKIRYPLQLNDFEKERLEMSKPFISELNNFMIINTKPFLSLNQVKAKIYQSIQQLGIKVIFLDHLQRCNIDSKKGQNEARAIEEFVFRLADIAKEFGVSLIMLSQIANIAEGNFATIQHLKHSGGISEGTDVILIMNRLARMKQDSQQSNKCTIDVWQRDGPGGRIELVCDLSTGIFSDTDELLNNERMNLIWENKKNEFIRDITTSKKDETSPF